MGIWVKSQNGKKLGEYNRFFYSYSGDNLFNIVGTNGVISDVLGIYDSEEKTETVIKMIQEHIGYCISSLNGGTLYRDDVIFEIPQDEQEDEW